MSLSRDLWVWAALMTARGLVGALSDSSNQTVIADLVESPRRPDAYALWRAIANVGFTIGAMVGGFLAADSYQPVFLLAGSSVLISALIIGLKVPETLPAPERGNTLTPADEPVARAADYSYRLILRDRPFLLYCGLLSLVMMIQMGTLFLTSVYTKEQFGLGEDKVGLMMVANGLTVVFFSLSVTHWAKRYRVEWVSSVGASLYMLCMVIMILARDFAAFLSVLILLAVAEIVVMPTATAYVSNRAAPDLRGRYMSTLSLGLSLGVALGPVGAGLLNDHIAPVAIWYGGVGLGLAATIGFALLTLPGKNKRKPIAY